MVLQLHKLRWIDTEEHEMLRRQIQWHDEAIRTCPAEDTDCPMYELICEQKSALQERLEKLARAAKCQSQLEDDVSTYEKYASDVRQEALNIVDSIMQFASQLRASIIT
ncbi:hypothetical protein Slin15195_G129870 [Septoria linicola]|uniref:Uncharacterized protein n=1 Tax=Septoria linicola TaxID=215465 RepID=A0A9Q9B959_9PEZI|nr:hypothetical protein Slin15195_G129870 [Septoria linicola]